MGFPWRKLAGIGRLGGLFVPGLTQAIDAIQAAVPHEAGASKKAIIEAVSDSVLMAAIQWDKLSPADAEAIRTARSQAIDAYVAARKAETEAREAFDAFEAAVAAVRTPDQS